MPLHVKFNARQLEVNLSQLGDRAIRGMSNKMRGVAREIRDLAREYAPVKTGLLERNIDYITLKKGGRNSYAVYIDLDAIRASGNGQLGDYAFLMEEQLHPYGRTAGGKSFYLGPLSMQKAAGGKKVGGRFLSRAIKDGTKDLLNLMAAEVQRVTNSTRSVNVQYQRIESDPE